MPAAIPFVTQAAAAIVVSTLGLGAVGSAIVYGASALVGGLLHRELMGSDSQASELDSLRLNHISTNRTMPLIYGSRLIGSIDVFIEGDNRGDYLWIVSVLGEGEVEGLDQVELIEEGEPPRMVDAVYIDGKLAASKDYSGLVEYWFYNGTASQTVNTELRDNTREGEDEKYTDNLKYTAYIVYKIKFDRDVFVSVPRREVVVKGSKIFDYRTSTSVYSRNPAIMLYDYLVNSRYGLGWDSSKIDIQSWTETANYCDSKGWLVDFVFASKLKSQVIIDNLLGHFRGFLLWYDGSLYLRYMDSLEGELPVFNVEDQHIARDEQGRALVNITHPSRFSTPDALSISFVDKRNNWTVDNIIIGDSNGQIRQVDFMGFTDRGLAIEMGTYTLERQRLNRTLSFVLRPDTVLLDPNDLVEIECKELGISQTRARIKSSVLMKDGLVSVSAILDDDTLYNQTYEPDESEIYETNLPSITDDPPAVVLDEIYEEVYTVRQRSFVRLVIKFSPPPDYIYYKGAEIYMANAEDKTQPSPPPKEDFGGLGLYKASYRAESVEEGQTYYFKLLTVSKWSERVQSWDDGLFVSYKVTGVSRDLPACPTYLNATISRESVEMYTNRLDDPDISGYEFRKGPIGTSWKDSLFVTKQSKPSISWDSLVPGQYTFWVNTQHMNGYYCPNPLSYDIDIPVPPNSTRFFDYWIDFRIGTKNNTQESSGGIQLQRVPGSSSKQGDYTTETIAIPNDRPDLKSLIYVKGEFTVSGGGDTWIELTTPSTDWIEFAWFELELRWLRWEELVESTVLTLPGRLRIEADYWDSADPSDIKTVHNLEMLTAVVFGDRIRIKFNIEDASLASYVVLANYYIFALYIDESLLISA